MAVNLVRGTAVPCCRTKVAAPQAVSHHLLPRALRCSTPAITHAAKQHTRCVIVEAAKGFGTAKTDAPALLLPSCPCQSGKAYKHCCEPAHTGAKTAKSAEAALRARFSAFGEGLEKYISDTTHESYLAFHYDGKSTAEAKEQYTKDIHSGCTLFEYEDLKIVKAEQGESEDEWLVAYSYKSCVKGEAVPEGQDKAWKTTTEKSRFVRVNGAWLFADYQRFEYNMNSLMQDSPKPVK